HYCGPRCECSHHGHHLLEEMESGVAAWRCAIPANHGKRLHLCKFDSRCALANAPKVETLRPQEGQCGEAGGCQAWLVRTYPFLSRFPVSSGGCGGDLGYCF